MQKATMYRALLITNLFATVAFFAFRVGQEIGHIWSGWLARFATAILILFLITWLAFVTTFTIRYVDGRKEDAFCRIWLILSSFCVFLFFSGLLHFVCKYWIG